MENDFEHQQHIIEFVENLYLLSDLAHHAFRMIEIEAEIDKEENV